MTFVMPWVKTQPAESILSQIRDVPLAHVIRDEVLSSILRGELAPGERITEPAIALKLGVSRVPVREALRDLESTGLVESRKHAGVFVRQMSSEETAELYELRAVLDAYAGRVASSVPNPALVTLLDDRLAKMDAAAVSKDVIAYYEANLHFHWDIINACGNRQICDAYRGVVQKLHIARLRNLSTDIGILNSIREHHTIVDAIRNGRPADCEALMSNHVKAAGARLAKIHSTGDQHEQKSRP